MFWKKNKPLKFKINVIGKLKKRMIILDQKTDQRDVIKLQKYIQEAVDGGYNKALNDLTIKHIPPHLSKAQFEGFQLAMAVMYNLKIELRK